MNNQYTLGEIAESLALSLIGDGRLQIETMSSLKAAKPNHIAYIGNKKYLSELQNSKAGAVILSQQFAQYYNGNKLISANPNLSAAQCSQLFNEERVHYQGGYIDPSAIIDPSANIDPRAYIGAYSVIEANVQIGKYTIIKPYCHISRNVCIGQYNILHSHIVIGTNCQIGDYNHIKPHTIIGYNGFGNVLDGKRHWQAIYHLGAVSLANHIHIGANTTIDNGRFEHTTIADGVRLDNLIHIAHNVQIGAHSAIAAGVRIAGSTIIGKNCMIGGMVGINDHLKITDDVIIYPGTTVRENIDKPGEYFGALPFLKKKAGLRLYAILKHHKLQNTLQKLIQK